MYRRILVPVDGKRNIQPRRGRGPADGARERRAAPVVHALDELAYLSAIEYSADLMKQARDQGARVLEDAQSMAQSASVPADGKLVETAGRRLGELVAEEARGVGSRPGGRRHPWPARHEPLPAGKRRRAGASARAGAGAGGAHAARARRPLKPFRQRPPDPARAIAAGPSFWQVKRPFGDFSLRRE
jgi:hypothetical protein